jgi:hypothetical protein
MNTYMNSEVSTVIPAPVLAKRGPGRPKSEGPTVASLRAEIKSLDAWRRPRGLTPCYKMNKAALLAYLADVKAAATAH